MIGMIDWIDVAGGVLEMIAISIIVLGLNKDKQISRNRIAVFIVLVIIILPLVNSFDIPYHAFLTVTVEAFLSWLILKIEPVSAITDSISGFVWVLLYQLLCSIPIMMIVKAMPLAEIPLMFLSMSTMVIIAWFFVNSTKMQYIFSRFYYSNRKVILWIWITALIVCALIINLWSPEQTRFSNQRVELLIIVGIYIVLNSLFIYSVFRSKKTEKELFEAHEYEDYLQEVMKQMRGREHEYKNHLQHIISIAESDQSVNNNEKIISYTEQLMERNGSKQLKSLITDNISISVFLFQAKKRAEKECVHLEYFVDKPFPEYHIPEKDLVELVSNAINNAFEAVEDLEPENRNIFMSFQTDYIEIINSIMYTSDISYGISIKGTDRGYGRMNMKRIADKYKIKLETQIEENQYIVSMQFK